MDHPGTFGDAAYGHGTSSDRRARSAHLDGRIGGHDGARGILASIRMKTGRQCRDSGSKSLHRKRFADDSGGPDQHILGGESQRACRQCRHFDGVPVSPPACAGIGVAAVGENGPALAAAQPPLIQRNRRRRHLVGSEDAGDDGVALRHDQRQVQDVRFFDACGNSGRPDSRDGRNSSGQYVHRVIRMSDDQG